MKERNKFFVLLGVLTVSAAIYYWFTTDHTQEEVRIGIVDANQVLVSARIGGRIEKLAVDEGSDVQAGDLIAVLDSAELNAQRQASAAQIGALRAKVEQARAQEASSRGDVFSSLSAARAKLESTKAALEEAKADRERLRQDDARIQKLAAEGVASAQERDRSAQSLKAAQARVEALAQETAMAQDQIKVAEAHTHQAQAAESEVAAAHQQVANAEAQLTEAETRVGYTRVLAPVTGTVSVRVARQGEVVAAGAPIVTIVDYTDTWVRAAVPETLADRIAVGASFKVRLAGGRILDGQVITKAAESDFATQRDVSNKKRDIKTVVLKLKVPNDDRALVPGMTAELLIPRAVLEGK